MARYIDANALIEFLDGRGYFKHAIYRSVIEDFPTVDEERAYKRGRQDAAEQIFEELDKRMIDITTDFSTLKAIGKKALGRLKKKYTESEGEE